MFRVAGRDAQGTSRELSVGATNEQEARALAQAAGLVVIERVSTPGPLKPSRLPKLSGFAVGCLTSIMCVVLVAAGAVIGALVARDSAPLPAENAAAVGSMAPSLLLFRDLDIALHGAAVGAAIGLLCGVMLLLACFRRLRERRRASR